MPELYVLWCEPDKPIPEDAIILSFLPPSVEHKLEQIYGDRIIRAREASLGIRDQARQVYMNIVARIGLVPCWKGKTLRQALARPGQRSRWWYHPIPCKDVDSSRVFARIIAALTIQSAASDLKTADLVLVGAPVPVEKTLQSVYEVRVLQNQRDNQSASLGNANWLICLRFLWISLRFFIVTNMRRWVAARRHRRPPRRSFDVILVGPGIWGWAFKDLPEALRQHGIGSIGKLPLWFVFQHPQEKQDDTGIISLLWFRSLWDIVRVGLDFSPLLKYLKVRRHPDFRKAFYEAGLDFYPLFERELHQGFINLTLQPKELMTLAMKRLCRWYRPKVVVNHMMELQYLSVAGVERSGVNAICGSIQVACYGREKMAFFLHPKYEFSGDPDECAIPHPDFVCAMGTYGRQLYLESGYSKNAVYLTGSTRYASINRPSSVSPKTRGDAHQAIHLLMVTSVSPTIEMEMVEAVWTATRKMPNIELMLRSSPAFQLEAFRFEKRVSIQRFLDGVSVSQNSLSDDLKWADLVLFTYCTVGAEAYVQGKPAWQWLSLDFNGSPLPEVVSIPRFGSVKDLRKALEEFRANPAGFVPTLEDRQKAYDRLFCHGSESASRIADVVSQKLTERKAAAEKRYNG